MSFEFERNAGLPTEMRVYDDSILDHQLRVGRHDGDAALCLKMNHRRIDIQLISLSTLPAGKYPL